MANKRRVVAALLALHGRTFASELGLRRHEPFALLAFAVLAAAPVPGRAAVRAAAALRERGWDDPGAVARVRLPSLVAELRRAGYPRFPDRAARSLRSAARGVVADLDGDLSQLREGAGGDAEALADAIAQIPGVGAVACDVFLREAQAWWPELRPYAGERALQTAAALGLPPDEAALAELCPSRDWPRLVAALVRTRLVRDEKAVLAAAGAKEH